MNAKILPMLVLIIVGIIVIASGFYVVNETQQVVITRFGQPSVRP